MFKKYIFISFKNSMMLFFIITSITTQITGMNGYEYIARLTNSLLKEKCLLCKKRSFFKDDIQKNCDFLNEKLKNVATTGGARVSSGNSYWSGIFNYAEYSAQNAHIQKNKQAIDIILADSSPKIKEQEFDRLLDLAQQLALEYDARILTKKVYKQVILEELLKEKELIAANNSTVSYPINERYPYISNMPDISNTPDISTLSKSSQLKHVCLNPNKSWRVRRSCDQIEQDYKKVAETGYIKFGFLSSTKFKDKTKEHEYAINIILPNESENNKFAELVRCDAYALELQQNYRKQADLKSKRESEERWQKYRQEREKAKAQKNIDENNQ